jgi:hypothetical protein
MRKLIHERKKKPIFKNSDESFGQNMKSDENLFLIQRPEVTRKKEKLMTISKKFKNNEKFQIKMD